MRKMKQNKTVHGIEGFQSVTPFFFRHDVTNDSHGFHLSLIKKYSNQSKCTVTELEDSKFL